MAAVVFRALAPHGSSLYFFVKSRSGFLMAKPISPKLCRSVGEASELLKLLANPNRLAIICLLLEQEAAVAELEDELGIRQPTLSQQLAGLRDAELIEGRRDGKSIIYRVADERVKRLVEVLRNIFSGLDDVTGHRTGRGPSSPVEDMMFD